MKNHPAFCVCLGDIIKLKQNSLILLARPAGFEPAIFGSGGRRLIHWATGAYDVVPADHRLFDSKLMSWPMIGVYLTSNAAGIKSFLEFSPNF